MEYQPDTAQLAQRICTRLDLDPKAGLGQRLAESVLRQDTDNPGLFHIYTEDFTQASSLAYALSILAKDILQLQELHFKPQYTKSESSW